MKTGLLISAHSGLWRDALESYLRANRELDIHIVGKELGEMYLSLDHITPKTLLLEADMCGKELESTLLRIQANYPDLNCIVIVDTPDQYRTAVTTGVSQIVMKSMLHSQLDVFF